MDGGTCHYPACSRPFLSDGCPWFCRITGRAKSYEGEAGHADGRPKTPSLRAGILFFLFFLLFLARLLRLLLFVFFRAFGFLHFQFAAQQFDDGQLRAVAFTVSELDNAAVAPVAIGETRSNRIKYFLCHGLAKKKCLKLAAGVKVVALAERNHFLRKRTNLLCLRQSRHETAVIQKIRNEITKQRAAVGRVPAEFAMRVPVSHITPFALSRRASTAG